MWIYILFDRNVLIPFDLAFNWHHFYLFLRDDLLVILDALLDGIVILLDHFPRDCLYDLPLLVGDDLALDWHFLHVCPVLILDYLLLVGHVAHPALTCLNRHVPFTTYSLRT